MSASAPLGPEPVIRCRSAGRLRGFIRSGCILPISDAAVARPAKPAKAATAPLGDGHEYDIYPKGLEGRYEEQRRGVGKQGGGAAGKSSMTAER